MRTLLLAAGLTMGSMMVFAQELPIKMGLWERSVNTTNPAGETMTTKTKSCVTPVSWQRMVDNASKPRKNCKIDTRKTANGYTFSATCTVSVHVKTVISGSSKITDSEHVVSDSRSILIVDGQKKNTITHSDTRFVAADCGTVKPYETKSAGK